VTRTIRILDLFCGEGGAAMGYWRAAAAIDPGARVVIVGIDNARMPRYPFEFRQQDALDLAPAWLDQFDLIHASPPCQAYSIMRNLPWLRGREYWDSIPPTRALLATTRTPWVIENVQGAPLDGIRLCGMMFGHHQPDGGPQYRHRLFEASPGIILAAPAHPKHVRAVVPGPLLGDRQRRMSGNANADKSAWRSTGIDTGAVGNGTAGARVRWGAAMGIDWMSAAGLSQAIPPDYTEHVGRQALAAIL
jgi:DNA (cytosine-5)-methyltransferase 1